LYHPSGFIKFSFPSILILYLFARYERVGRFIPGDGDRFRMMLDGSGEIGVILMADLLLLFGGMIQDWPKKKAALFVMRETE